MGLERHPIRTAGFAYLFGLAVVLVVSLVTCSRCCHADPLSTEAGFRAALERLP